MSGPVAEPLTFEQTRQGLRGRAPKPFKVGRVLELLMDNDRLCRGIVVAAGRRVALMDADEVAPGRRRRLIISYRMVRKWKVPGLDAPWGNWMPNNPAYQRERSRGG